MIDLNNLPFTFDKMIEAIESKENFSLSRWGDGEWMCLLGFKGHNTDKHIYYPEMGERLKSIIETGGNGELLALQSLALKDLSHLEEFNKYVEDISWDANAEILSRNHSRDKEFFKAIQTDRELTIVGNKFLRNVPLIYDRFVEIPERNCWLEYESIKADILTTVDYPDKKGGADCIILYCASMMANVLINDLHSPNYTQIDVGSFLDPYVGRMTRRYHHNLEI